MFVKSNGIDYVLVKAIPKEKQNRGELVYDYIGKEEFIKNLKKYHIKNNQQKIIDDIISGSEAPQRDDIKYCDTRQLNKTRFNIPIGNGKFKAVLLHKKLPTVVF